MQCNAMFNKLRFENTIKTVLKVKTVSLICRIIILIQFNLMYSFNSKKDKYTVLTILHQNDFFKPFFGGHPYFRGFRPHEHQFFLKHPFSHSTHPFLQIILAAKWLVRHSSTSPDQQRRTACAFSSVFILLLCFTLTGALCG